MVVDKIKDVMEINKNEVIGDYSTNFTDKEKIYNTLYNRNKCNKRMIAEFISK